MKHISAFPNEQNEMHYLAGLKVAHLITSPGGPGEVPGPGVQSHDAPCKGGSSLRYNLAPSSRTFYHLSARECRPLDLGPKSSLLFVRFRTFTSQFYLSGSRIIRDQDVTLGVGIISKPHGVKVGVNTVHGQLVE